MTREPRQPEADREDSETIADSSAQVSSIGASLSTWSASHHQAGSVTHPKQVRNPSIGKLYRCDPLQWMKLFVDLRR